MHVLSYKSFFQISQEVFLVFRIEVGIREGCVDARGDSVKRSILEDLDIQVDKVRTIDVYTIEGDLEQGDIEVLRKGLFTDPIIQESKAGGPLASDFDWLIEVAFRPGVTDNVGRTALEGIQDLLRITADRVGGAYTAVQYLVSGDIRRDEAERIARDLLANELIQHWEIRSREEWEAGEVISPYVPKVKEDVEVGVQSYDLEIGDEDLIELSEKGILFLSLDEMKVIRNYYRNEAVREDRARVGLGPMPTDVELEALAQTWSEHCKHKIFNSTIHYKEGDKEEVIDSLFRSYVRGITEKVSEEIDWLLSVFHDNAGVIRFNDDYNLVMKVETHNSPSALDPYGGALTGIVGVNRDPLGTGLGSRLIFNTDIFCFAAPDDTAPIPPRLLHPKRVFRGVHRGVKDGGNESGIPVVNGSIIFDTRYRGKPLVFCGTGGLMPARIGERLSYEKEVAPGDLVVMVGGRIGKDGIHGATFSSVELTAESPATAVQIGDPITQKKMVDFILEARDEELFTAITDNGAGGLSSSVGEMATYSGGSEIHLDRAPLKYQGLSPWEILLSEAQERMTLAVPPENEKRLLELGKKHDVELTNLGTFTDSGRFHVHYAGETVAYLEMDFFHEGLPNMELYAEWTPPKFDEPELEEPDDLGGMLRTMLERWNVCSKESFVRQYDHEVQGMSVVKPFVGVCNDGPSDAAVIRPLLSSEEGIIISNGISSKYSDIDTYHMAACSLDEAVRNLIAVGGNLGYIAGLDNFCWPDPIVSGKTPDGKYKLAQLVRANRGLYDTCIAYGVPLISGKDSMKNDFGTWPDKVSIPPTLMVTALGKINDVNLAVTLDVKGPGDRIYVVGLTREELGGSEYYSHMGYVGNQVPVVDASTNRKVYGTISRAINCTLVSSCHDCSDGGLGVTLAESAFAGGLGMVIDLRNVPSQDIGRDDFILFSESQGRFVVTVEGEKSDEFEGLLGDIPWGLVGEVTEDRSIIIVGLSGDVVLREDVMDLKRSWQGPLDW
jgi:phosphoribosylformylglycinamidine synthase